MTKVKARRFDWTEERVSQLVEMNARGCDPGEIADAVGAPSRRVVTGKLWLLANPRPTAGPRPRTAADLAMPNEAPPIRISRTLLRRALAEGLALGEPQAQVLVVLIERAGERLTTTQMCILVDPHRPLKRNVFQERIRAIREAMGHDAIAGFSTARDRGHVAGGGFQNGYYALSASGLERCRDALQALAAKLPLQIAPTPVAENQPANRILTQESRP